MKKYIVYTDGGYTQDEKSVQCENCQVLDICFARNVKEAKQIALKTQIDSGNTFTDKGNIFVAELA